MSVALPGRPPTDRISYQDLYSRWERANWSATEIDFSEDARQWQEEFRAPRGAEVLPRHPAGR